VEKRMNRPRNLVFAVMFVIFALLTHLAHATATNFYVTPSGSAVGNCPAGTTSTPNVAFGSMSSSNWGTGTGQIGPGTTVLLCGTWNVTAGAAGFQVLGSGSSGGGYITIQADTTFVMQSAYLGSLGGELFSRSCGPQASCLAGITVYGGRSYVILDGVGAGIIQNTANGTNLANQQSSVGIYINGGDHIIVRGWTIQDIYLNAGSSSGATDTVGWYSADIRVDNGATNLAVYNNTLLHAHAGLTTDTNGTTGPNNCPTPIGVTGATTPASVPAPSGNWGICLYNNTLSEHGWQILAGGQGTVNIFSNQEGDIGSNLGWLNWQFPTSTYHQDGIFIWGDETYLLTAYVYNNYSHGDLGQSSPSGHLYCASNDISGTNASGCSLIAFNNVIVQTGSTQWPNDAKNDQLISVDLDSYSISGPVKLYNNTLVGGAYGLEMYTSGSSPQGGATAFTWENTIWEPSIPGTATGWFDNSTNGGVVMSSVTAKDNVYYNGNKNPWNLNSTNESTLSAWKTACSCDTGSLVSNPLLNSNYTLQSGSPARGLGANLTSLGITALNYDIAGDARPSTGAWDAGAYQGQGTPNVTPPTGLTAVIH
jgi:hypothetical protein